MCRLSPHINTRTWIANRALRKGETNMNSPKDTVAVVRDGLYVILGASGNAGSIIANFLLSKGEKVRVVGREVGRLQRFARKGAEAFTADLSDAAALTKAFSGARAAYLMLPPLNSREERSEEHTSELQSPDHLVCRLLLEKKMRTRRPKLGSTLPVGSVRIKCTAWK